jgi:hypothetical protein
MLRGTYSRQRELGVSQRRFLPLPSNSVKILPSFVKEVLGIKACQKKSALVNALSKALVWFPFQNWRYR